MVFPVNMSCRMWSLTSALGMSIGETASESPQKSITGTSRRERADIQRGSRRDLANGN